MKRLLERLRALRVRRDQGASAVEYGLLVALIAVVISAAVVVLGNALNQQFTNVCETVATGTDADCPDNGGDGQQ